MKIRTRIIGASILAAAAGIAGLALAQPGPGPGERGQGPGMGPDRLMERADTNKDGKISKEEYNKAVAARFAAMDTNHDGVVSEQELYQAGLERYKKRVTMMFKMMDRNSDGKITADEMPHRMPPFAVLDVNGDGVITDDDFKLLREEHPRGPHMMGRGMHGGGGFGRDDDGPEGGMGPR